MVSSPDGNEEESGGKTLDYIESFPWFVRERWMAGMGVWRH